METIGQIPGAPVWLTKAVERLNKGCPLYRGKFTDPFSHPDLPRGKSLHEWLKADAPDDLKEYCRESLRFYRQHKQVAPEWYEKLEHGIR